MLDVVPVTLATANAFVAQHHRHHRPVVGHKFSIGCTDTDDNDGEEKLVGVAIVGRPVSRHLDDGFTLEVNRCCTDGTKNACSMLYAAAWRAARAIGYRKLITYILETESGISLKAVGWKCAGEAGGLRWTGERKPEIDLYPAQKKLRFEIKEDDNMAAKRQFDTNILTSMKTVASGSFADNIKMIDIEKLKPHRDNFYSMTDIELLADDIERQGLKHNLVVCEDKNSAGSYIIISGHRRYEAVKSLIKQGRRTSKFVPCFLNGIKSENETMYEVVMLNATSRKMSDGEMIKQHDVLVKLLKDLKREGVKFDGRAREHIARVLNISTGQAGKIENVKNNAIAEIKEAVDNGMISISTANEVASLTKDEQKKLIENKPPEKISVKEVKKIKEREKELKRGRGVQGEVTVEPSENEENEKRDVLSGADYFNGDLVKLKRDKDKITVKPIELPEKENPSQSLSCSLDEKQIKVFLTVFKLIADDTEMRNFLKNDFKVIKDFVKKYAKVVG
jgi:ParB family chromosome partitioning protein